MMKRLFALILFCLLLCGCVRDAASTEPVEDTLPLETVQPTAPVGMYAAGHPLEVQYQGSLRVYPLTMRKVQGMRALNDGLLVFSGYGSTTLTLLTEDELFATASITLDFDLFYDDPSLRLHDGELSYFDPVNRQTVVLDSSLREVSHIAAPEDLVGSPILSADRNILYYCTADSVRAWDLETGIRRCVKEMFFDSQTVTGLHMEDTVLQCRIQDGDTVRTMLFSTDSGLLLYEGEGDLPLSDDGDTYYASVPTGMIHSLVFGTEAAAPSVLTPADITSEGFFLERSHTVVTASILSDDRVQLDHYDLDTGRRDSVLTLNSFFYPVCVEAAEDDSVYLLVYDPAQDCDMILRWDVGSGSTLLLSDGTDYTGSYYTVTDPDYEGLAQCRDYAARLSEKYGVEVLVWEDAMTVQPWDYDFSIEYLVPVIRRELELLDERLSQYPEEVLTTTASHFTALKICLVRQLTGTAESGSLDTATGIQFFDGTDAYVAIAVGEHSDQALYHELFHVMETHIWNDSIAFDQWESLNPDGFAYDYDYLANAQRDAEAYLEEGNRAFVDTYSMSFPKEDRARIMEYAMLPGNGSVFSSHIMQLKLLTLCQGIREAYRLEKVGETFLWEQYLTASLAYTE